MLLVEFLFGVGLSVSVGLSKGSSKKVCFVYPMDDALDCRKVFAISVGMFRFPRLIVLLSCFSFD